MTPAARIQAAVEVLAGLDDGARPAEQVVSDYFRKRRYIGAKDRRAVSDMAYGTLRRRARLHWHLRRQGSHLPGVPPFEDRLALLAYLVLSGDQSVETLDQLCSGERYAPPPLNREERASLQRLEGEALESPCQAEAVRFEIPEWLLPDFEASLGAALPVELAALSEEAPLDLRANTLKAGREEALAALAEEGIAAEPTPLSPLGLRVRGRRSLRGGRAFSAGLVEVQDEGSQLAALLCDARPEMAVADVCAGGGGKSLALAAAMAGRGRLLASDVDQRRLDRAAARFRRAGADFVERRVIPDLAEAKNLADRFDRVLVDAPCSGSGAWRRQPDARWRLTPEALAGYRAAQQELLAKAATLVRQGGRLIYVTCSLLDEENEDQVRNFLEAHEDFAVHPVDEVWARQVAAPCPATGSFLTLTPAAQGTDGFFVALLDRREPA